MTRKKKVKEEQAVTAEVVETKKKSSKKAPKTKMSAQKESIQETGFQEPIVNGKYFFTRTGIHNRGYAFRIGRVNR